MNGLAIVPQPEEAGTFVELSRTKQGRLFEKQILAEGDLHYGGQTIKIDSTFLATLTKNFHDGACDIVQVPIANAKNQHTEDPRDNLGEVIGLTTRDGKMFAQIDARDEAHADKLGKTFLGASAMMDLNYKDTKTNKFVGPTLLHVAVTNRPYVTGLDAYKEVVSLSADGNHQEAVVLTAAHTKEKRMTLDELIEQARTDHGIDIPALQKTAADHDAAVALSNRVQTELAETGMLTLSNGQEATGDDVVGAISEMGKQIVSLTSQVNDLNSDSVKTKATARVESLIREGRILPAAKDAQIALLSRDAETFEALLPPKAIVALSQDGSETGFIPLSNDQDVTVASEVDRLAGLAKTQGYIRD